MSDTEIRGGFAGDPAAALNPAAGSGCCGSPATSAVVRAEPGAAAPCCGTQAEAIADNSCCGSTAKAEAVAAGQGCCG